MLNVYGHEHYAWLQLIQPVGYHRPSATGHDFQSLYFINPCETHSFAIMVESFSMKWSIQTSLNAMHGNLPIGYTICFGPERGYWEFSHDDGLSHSRAEANPVHPINNRLKINTGNGGMDDVFSMMTLILLQKINLWLCTYLVSETHPKSLKWGLFQINLLTRKIYYHSIVANTCSIASSWYE